MPNPTEGGGDPSHEGDTIRILLATDCHIGYLEKDGIRGEDSFRTFDEILKIAVREKVDFVLLGGDLFHDNKPSRRALHEVMVMLRKYCLGDRPCQVEFRSDPSINFGHTKFPTVNYEDPNLNVSMPVFSIHGNHDDPTGQGNLCSLDLLSVAGLVNYFGKYTDLEKIEINPVLLQKGQSKLALYGLGSIRDERLHRMFLHKNVHMLRPKEQAEEWFNLFVLHQNHAKHGPKNYIPEQFLDDFLDLVFWGHEHECKIEPNQNVQHGFYVTQPGSSVATSLSEGETKQKHVGLLQIKGKDFKLSKIPLKTVRQFYMEDVVLSRTSLESNDPDCARNVEIYCQEKVDSMLQRADLDRIGNNAQPELPLIRLRVDYSGGFDLFPTYKFGQKYVNKVANPKDMVLFQRRKLITKKEDDTDEKRSDEILANMRPESLDSARVEDMVREYFNKCDKSQQLSLLTEKSMTEGIRRFVDKEERDYIPELVKYQLEKTQKHLRNRRAGEDVIDQEIVRFKELRRGEEVDKETQEVMQNISGRTPKDELSTRLESGDEEPGYQSDDSTSTSSRGRGRGRGRGRASRGGRGQSNESTSRGRGSRGGRGARAGRGKAPVVEETSRGSLSIKEAFASASQKTSGRNGGAKRNSTFRYSDQEVTVIDSDDDMSYSSAAASGRKRKANESSLMESKSKSRGVLYDDGDDDEGDLFDVVPKRRRR